MKPGSHMLMSTIWGELGGDLLCFHCGEHEASALPCGLDVFAARIRKFCARHRTCRLTGLGEDLRTRHDAAFADLRGTLPATPTIG